MAENKESLQHLRTSLQNTYDHLRVATVHAGGNVAWSDDLRIAEDRIDCILREVDEKLAKGV